MLSCYVKLVSVRFPSAADRGYTTDETCASMVTQHWPRSGLMLHVPVTFASTSGQRAALPPETVSAVEGVMSPTTRTEQMLEHTYTKLSLTETTKTLPASLSLGELM